MEIENSHYQSILVARSLAKLFCIFYNTISLFLSHAKASPSTHLSVYHQIDSCHLSPNRATMVLQIATTGICERVDRAALTTILHLVKVNKYKNSNIINELSLQLAQ